MRTLLNIIWLVFTGIWTAIAWCFAALLLFITIIGIPFGIQAVKIAAFTLWPFGRTLVKRPSAGVPSAIGNVLWLLLAGWWLAILHVIAAIALTITIIGIPLAAGHLKMIPVSLLPFGREIVTVEQAHALEAGTEIIAVHGTEIPSSVSAER